MPAIFDSVLPLNLIANTTSGDKVVGSIFSVLARSNARQDPSHSSQRETKKQARPMVTKSSSSAMKISLMFNAVTKRRRVS